MAQGFINAIQVPGGGGGSSPWVFGAGTNSALGGDGTSTSAGANSVVYGAGNVNGDAYDFIFGINNTTSGGNYSAIFGNINTVTSSYYGFLQGAFCQAINSNHSFVTGASSVVNADYGFARGNTAIVNYQGSVVWGDSNISPATDTAQDQFCLTFANGYYFNGGVIHSPKIDAINDPINNLPALTISGIASAVNGIQVSNSTTGNDPGFEAIGADTNITPVFLGKGNGGVGIQGVTSGLDFAPGYVGEFVSSQVLSASATSISSATPTDLTFIDLSAGDWDVWGNVIITPTVGMTAIIGSIGTVSSTLSDISLWGAINSATAFPYCSVSPVQQRISTSVPVTVYLVGYAQYATGTATQCGGLYARRVR